jgi:hypothetical protein
MIALPVLVALLGAVIEYVWTGHGPQTLHDYFFPKNSSGQAWALPSYMKDVFHFATEPGKAAQNKIHPMLAAIAEMLENRDYTGTEIRNPDDPLVAQLLGVAKHFAATGEPLSARNMQRAIEQNDRDDSDRSRVLK